LNAIASLDVNFPDCPKIIVYDIGFSFLTLVELRRMRNVELRPMPPFVPHWRLNWSWKLYALTFDLPRYVLYLDLPNFVILRSLSDWFESIKVHGYFLVTNGQTMRSITPSDYWKLHGVDEPEAGGRTTFGAGIIGFDRDTQARAAIEMALASVRLGLNLGRSAAEGNSNYRPNILRDCDCFRADQTILNLAFQCVFGESLELRKPLKYCGSGGPRDHPSQYLWYSRRDFKSLSYIFSKPTLRSPLISINRARWSLRLNVIRLAKFVLRK
jgi:hypothetical protein